jgi:hypothetical protein
LQRVVGLTSVVSHYTQTPQVVQGSMSAMAMLQRLSEISADRVRT